MTPQSIPEARSLPREMAVIRAEVMGLCFGVRDALDVAFSREDASDITIYGELVHNEAVLERLRLHGFHVAPEDGRESAIGTDTVLITAHGVSNSDRARLEAEGKKVIDTTCPLVRKVHNAALRLQAAGYYPVVIGKHGHVEVRGIVGDLDEFTVVATVDEATALVLDRPRIGVVCQTTFPETLVRAILAGLKSVNPAAEVRFHNTVCDPTRQRLAAVARLLARVDAMVVVGGRNSNNTRQLLSACEAGGVRAVQVQTPQDLDPEWFAGCHAVGVTAGTSTPDADLDRVYDRLLAIARRDRDSPLSRLPPARQ